MNVAQPVVLFVLLPEYGAFNASFLLAKELVRRGFRVVYFGPGDFKDHVTAQGLEYLVIDTPRQPKDDRKRWIWAKRRQRLAAFKAGYLAYSQLLAVAEREVSQLQPSLILLDPLMWRYSSCLLASGAPIVGLNTTLASTFSIERPPVFSAIIPSEKNGLRQRWTNFQAWLPLILKEWRATLRDDIRRLMLLGPWKAPKHRGRSLVRALGGRLAPGEYGPRLIVPELVMAPLEFEFACIARTTRRVYIGASVDVSRAEPEFDFTLLRDDVPLLYCSLGTYSKAYPHAKRLFSSVIDAFRDRADWQVVVQAGDVTGPEDFGSVPEHILVVKRAPQIALLRRASVFVTHGGFSSVRESILLGVPMIVFPCWLDQPGNASRVAYHQLGVTGDIANVTPAEITSLVEAVTGTEIAGQVKSMSAIFQAQSDGKRGAAWIEEFISRPPAALPDGGTFVSAATSH